VVIPASLRIPHTPPPLRFLAGGLVAGAWCGLLWPLAAVVLSAIATVAACVARARKPARRHTLAVVAASALLAGAARGADALPAPAPEHFRETPCVLWAVAESSPRVRRDAAGGCESLLSARLDEPGGRRAALRIRLPDRATPPSILPGDRLRVVGRAAVPRPPGNPGQRDRRADLRRRGVVLELAIPTPAAITVDRADPGSPVVRVRRFGAKLRSWLLQRLHRVLSDRPHARALATALLVGDRSLLRDDVAEAFRRAGAAHLLAVSGLHVVLLVGVVGAALETLRTRLAPGRRSGAVVLAITLAFVAVYAAVCDLATPVVRAALFVAVATVSRQLGRRTRTADHLAVAAAVVAAADPAQVLSPGFQLSFAAVLGLGTLTLRFREALFASWDLLARFPEAVPAWRLKLHAWLASGWSASLAAATATAPVTAWAFGELHPAAPLANLVAVPIVAMLLPAVALAALVGPAAAPVSGPLLDAGARALTSVLEPVAALPVATLEAAPQPVWGPALAAGILAMSLRVRPWRRRHLLAPLLAWLLLGTAPLVATRPAAAQAPSMVALDVGHGVAVLLLGGEGGGAVLYDAGGRLPGTAERVVAPALRALGVRRLDALAVSHEDVDHCGAVPELLARIPVGALLVPPGFGGSAAGRRVLRASARQGVPVQVLGRSDSWERPGVRLRALHPRAGSVGPAENEGSLVLHAELGGGPGPRLRVLLPGDIEGTTLEALSRDPTLPKSDVLLLPHHGRGPVAPQMRLADRCGAAHLVASTPATAPTSVPGALVTGRDGALRITPRRAPERLLR
jgi:competence protein ComEC